MCCRFLSLILSIFAPDSTLVLMEGREIARQDIVVWRQNSFEVYNLQSDEHYELMKKETNTCS